jgi:hydroxymethylglutaryl-CoA lyase
MVKIIESIRDGFQGLKHIIPTQKKADYINTVLKIGFDAIDVGSFVSEKAIPQMADTAEVIKRLNLSETRSKLMVLVGNRKGAEKASEFDEIESIIYPFSISSTFLKNNLNSDFKKSEKNINEIIEICNRSNKEVVIYLAMAFGNPYGDLWNLEIIHEWVEKLIQKGIKTIPLSDITNESNPEQIRMIYSSLISNCPSIEFGFHLHTSSNDWQDKVEAAYTAGCRRFDSVIGGLGGCPMTGYELLSNLDTGNLLSFLEKKTVETTLNKGQFEVCNKLLENLF